MYHMFVRIPLKMRKNSSSTPEKSHSISCRAILSAGFKEAGIFYVDLA